MCVFNLLSGTEKGGEREDGESIVEFINVQETLFRKM